MPSTLPLLGNALGRRPDGPGASNIRRLIPRRAGYAVRMGHRSERFMGWFTEPDNERLPHLLPCVVMGAGLAIGAIVLMVVGLVPWG